MTRVTVPVPIGDAQLLSTNVPVLAPGEANYNPATTYPIDAQVVNPLTHRKYQSLQAGNVGKPLPVYPARKTDWWFDVGVTNQRAMFDLERNTQTVGVNAPTGGSSIVVQVTPGVRCNTIGILGMEATDVEIEVRKPDGTLVYSYSENLIIRTVLDHYMYAYQPFETRSSTVRFDLPPFTDAVISIRISSFRDNCKCGSIIVGTYAYIGDAKYDAEADDLNFSTIDRDLYGTATLVPRRAVPKLNMQLSLAKKYVNRVRDIKRVLNAIPALWTGLDDTTDGYFDILLILGIYRKFSIRAQAANQAGIDLELEEI